MIKFVIATFEGTGEFPIDMLRYDGCYPLTENDSYAMVRNGDLRRVTVRKLQINKFPWTEKRWESFGWRIVATDERSLDGSLSKCGKCGSKI